MKQELATSISQRPETAVRLSAAAWNGSPYSPPALPGPIDLYLDANEALTYGVDLARIAAELPPDACRRYPSTAILARELAARFGVDPDRVIVTAGGDDAIDRACRVCLEPGRELILPVPTFEMIARSAKVTGASVVSVPGYEKAGSKDGAYPIEEVLAAITLRTSMIAVVSPNNPTGGVATASDLERLSAAAPEALVLVDLAYMEFADEDLAAVAIALPNAVVVRTFSKAMGLAGLRVGYAVGPEAVIRGMRTVGSPYPVSAMSLAAAQESLRSADDYVPRMVSRVRQERAELIELLEELGARPRPSQGNFVLAEFANAEWVWRALGGLGVAVRRFPASSAPSGLKYSLRITCPGDEVAFERLCHSLCAALRPKALLLDMDGVIADVSGSYRRAITLTAESFGVRVTPEDIAAAKEMGDANNDWVLTHRLVSAQGVRATLQEVTARFEALYIGSDAKPGLHETERLIPDRSALEALARRMPLAVVTGRPRRDYERFVRRFNLDGLFRATVCMEDAALKPDPAPVLRALELLGVTHAWMVGDTPDDVVAARSAAVIPIGFVPPGCDECAVSETLERAGAARVMTSWTQLQEMLP